MNYGTGVQDELREPTRQLHARGAGLKGATPEQAAEAIGVAILMNGGPATVYGPRAFAAFQEFHAQYAHNGQPKDAPAQHNH